MQTGSTFRSTAKLVVLALVLLGGCSGSIRTADAPVGVDESPAGEAPSSRPPGNSSVTSHEPLDPTDAESRCARAGSSVGLAQLRRLTSSQYANTVRDLLGVAEVPNATFLPDTKEGPFDTNSSVPATELMVEKYQQAAVALAQAADLAALVPCKPAEGNDRCADEFIAAFGRRAYRRPLADAEKTALRKLYDLGKQDGFEAGVRQVIEGALQSPNFLYLTELPPMAGARRLLSPYETATRLSYLLWNSMPDDELLDLAEKGALANKDRVVAEAERMLASDRARSSIDSFHTQWLGLDQLDRLEKNSAKYPQFSPPLMAAMRDETRAFAREVVWVGDAKVETLLTAAWSTPNDDALLSIYGAKRTDLRNGRLELDRAKRAGILTQPAVLARWATEHSAAVFRGIFVRENLLCDHLGAPPAAVSFKLPANADQLTAQEILRQHQESPACNSCHRLTDNIGFGLENFDGIGAYRTQVAGIGVDASGELVGTDVDGPFVGPRALAEKLAGSAKVKSCVAVQWFRYALGRSPTEADACSVADMNRTISSAEGNVRSMLLSLVASDAFRLIAAE